MLHGRQSFPRGRDPPQQFLRHTFLHIYRCPGRILAAPQVGERIFEGRSEGVKSTANNHRTGKEASWRPRTKSKL